MVSILRDFLRVTTGSNAIKFSIVVLPTSTLYFVGNLSN